MRYADEGDEASISARSAMHRPFITCTCKAPAPVLSIFAYSNEGLHANEDDLFLLAFPFFIIIPAFFFSFFYNFTLTGGEWRVVAVMAIRATG